MQYMNPLLPEDLEALNELGKLTWAWDLHYWTEKGLEHGSFYINFTNPRNLSQYRVDGYTICEAVNKAIISIKTIFLLDKPPTDYP